MQSSARFETLFDNKLKSSGLSLKQAKQLKLSVIRSGEVKKLGLPEGYAIKIPYYHPQGNFTEFFRLRYIEDIRTDQQIADGAKPLRYIQPSNTVNEIYLPALLDWHQIALDASIEIIITEGEFKAACAAAHGMACVGLGGVWCFKSAAHNMALIPAMKWLNWKDRVVTIMFDSDAATKPDVMAAECELALALVDLGAKPKIARLPTLEGFDKTGLDDFIVAKGHEALLPIIDKAVDFTGAAMLYELNKEVLYVRNPGLIVKLATNQRMLPRAFTDHAYANWTFTEQVFNKDGSPKMVIKSAPREWMKWQHRAEVERVIYAPGQPRLANNNLNVWPGWACEPKRGDVRLWKELLDYLFCGDAQARAWFEQWLAYPLQHPGTKLSTTAVLWGVNQGTGKSLVAYTMKRIYGQNWAEINEENLSSTFNEWAENKQFILGDDVTGKDQRAYADKLKSMLTRQVLRLNPKYIPSYEVQDCINYYFTSNQPDAFFLEDKDRRFFIHEVYSPPLADAWYANYDAWYKSEDGARALFHHLLSIDTKNFNPQAPAYVTASKLAMIEDVRSDVATWVHRLKRDPDAVLRKNGEVIKHDLWRTEDLLKVYDPLASTRVTVTGMARELKRADIMRAAEGKIVTTLMGQTRLWALRDGAKYGWMTPPQAASAYTKEREATGDVQAKPKKPIGLGRKNAKL